MTSTIKIRNYENIADDYISINGWQSAGSFTLTNGSISEKELLEKCNVLELVLEKKDEHIEFDVFFDDFLFYVKNILLSLKLPVFLFYSEHKKNIPNKLRSYKGIVPKELKLDSIQTEIGIENGYSLIGGITDLNASNVDAALTLFDDSQTSFIFTDHNNQFFSKESIEFIINHFMKHKGRSILNFVNLIDRFCTDGNLLFRIAGDGGITYLSLQIFYFKDSYTLKYFTELIDNIHNDKNSYQT